MCGTSSRRTHVEHYVIVNRRGCGRDLLRGASSRVSRVFQRSDGRDLTNRAGHPSRCYHLPSTGGQLSGSDPFSRFYLASSIVSRFRKKRKFKIVEIVYRKEEGNREKGIILNERVFESTNVVLICSWNNDCRVFSRRGHSSERS